MTKKTKINQQQKSPLGQTKIWWLVLATIFFVIFVFTGLILGASFAYAEKIYPKVKIGSLMVGGLSSNQVLELLKAKERVLSDQGLAFYFGDKKIAVNPI